MRTLVGNADDKDKELKILKGKDSKVSFFLVFVSMNQIVAYLTAIGEIRQSEVETNTLTQFSKIIMSNSK